MMDSREGDSLLPLHTDALRVAIVAGHFRVIRARLGVFNKCHSSKIETYGSLKQCRGCMPVPTTAAVQYQTYSCNSTNLPRAGQQEQDEPNMEAKVTSRSSSRRNTSTQSLSLQDPTSLAMDVDVGPNENNGACVEQVAGDLRSFADTDRTDVDMDPVDDVEYIPVQASETHNQPDPSNKSTQPCLCPDAADDISTSSMITDDTNANVNTNANTNAINTSVYDISRARMLATTAITPALSSEPLYKAANYVDATPAQKSDAIHHLISVNYFGSEKLRTLTTLHEGMSTHDKPSFLGMREEPKAKTGKYSTHWRKTQKSGHW
ncbi:hypothetical protein K438DRAFT_1776138 [Mycena galopus ATCC 62051]|nr:hypothetical protein K438DRAFT_1776138 [Mycena galopus ATCC 62051]